MLVVGWRSRHTGDIKVLSWFDSAGIWAHAVSSTFRMGVIIASRLEGVLFRRSCFDLSGVSRGILTGGNNGSHTLKATGVVFGFLMVRVWETS